MVRDTFLRSQEFSKPFFKKVRTPKNGPKEKTENDQKEKKFKIELDQNKNIEIKQCRVKFDFHSEIFDF
jgi:hypothetical protein